jgi:hypothetical protein
MHASEKISDGAEPANGHARSSAGCDERRPFGAPSSATREDFVNVKSNKPLVPELASYRRQSSSDLRRFRLRCGFGAIPKPEWSQQLFARGQASLSAPAHGAASPALGAKAQTIRSA